MFAGSEIKTLRATSATMRPMMTRTDQSTYENVVSDLCQKAEDLIVRRKRAINELEAVLERSQKLEEAIKSLLPLLDEEEQNGIGRRARAILAEMSGASGRYEANIDDVRKILSAGPPKVVWTAEKVEAELLRRGFNTKSKAVYNWINALASRRQLERVSRGRYRVREGPGLVSSDTLLEDDN